MSRLILPKRFYQQPQTPVGIDWNNPLTFGLKAAVIPSLGDLFDGQNVLQTDASLPAYVHTIEGVGSYHTGPTAELRYSSKLHPADWPGSGVEAYTIFCYCIPNGTGSSATYTGGLGLSSNNLQSVTFRANTNWYYYDRYSNTSVNSGIAVSSGVPVFLSGDANAQSTPTSNELRIFVNGILGGTANPTGTGTLSDSFNQFMMGGWPTASVTNNNFNGWILLGGAFNRVLDANEHAELASNPWQIFKPLARKVWVSAGGGGTTINASSTSLAITAEAASVNAKKAISASSTSLGFTLYQATISVGSTTHINAGYAALTMSAYQASVNAKKHITAAVASLALTTQAATVNAKKAIAATLATLAITANAATVAHNSHVHASLATMAMTAHAASVSAISPVNISAALAQLSMATYDATITQGFFWRAKTDSAGSWGSATDDAATWTVPTDSTTTWS